MFSIGEVSRISGVTVRTLRLYDRMGLLPPAQVTRAGYRMYDEGSLARLKEILLWRELEFSLKEIACLLEKGETVQALEAQIALLEARREHLENLLLFAKGIRGLGVKYMEGMDFSAFDRRKLDERIRQVRQQWGNTPAYREYEEKARQRTAQQEQALADDMMEIFREIGTRLGQAPDSEPVQELVRKLQAYITRHFYECTPQMFRCLGKMYVGGGELTQSIDAAGGPGTARLAGEAIELYCRGAE